jgi:PrtD family type I secretion system ABC transporter
MSPFLSDMARGLRRSRSALVGVAAFSAIANLLYLTGSFYMLEVYDRVIPSRSLPTLIGISALALMLYLFQGILDAIRGRLLARVGVALDAAVSAKIVSRVVRRRGADNSPNGDGLLPLRDLDQVRSFLSSTGPLALFDLPWTPLYLAICFMFHPLIGVVAFAGAVVLAAFAALTELLTCRLSSEALMLGQLRNLIIDDGRRNADAVAAMAMSERLVGRWSEANNAYHMAQCRVADVCLSLGAASKMFRIALQSAVLGLGSYLVIKDEATAGVMIAGSILTARALAPAELAIANWRSFLAARQSWRRLSDLLAQQSQASYPTWLPRPRVSLSVENLSVGVPGFDRSVISNASFRLRAGQAMGVIGPSGSGKSTLVKALIGAWPLLQGEVRFDEASIDQWPPESLGRDRGYLPHEAELLEGTIAENISRFDPNARSEAIIEAAELAGAHEMIVRLPQGYNTCYGEIGVGLSAGQRQRIGLARALYGNPFLVVLDEPNANLDGEGEAALTRAILGVRARGGICIVVSHRASVLAVVDMVAIVVEGRIQSVGAKEEVLRRVSRPASSRADPLAIPHPIEERSPRLRELAS